MDAVKRRSRFSTDPILNENGHPKAVPPRELTDKSDWPILATLARRRFQGNDFLAAQTGLSPGWVQDRTTILASEPYPYIKISDEQADPRNRRFYLGSRLQFELAPLGMQVLRKKGIEVHERKRVKYLQHQVMVDQIMASFEIAAKHHPKLIRLISRAQLRTHERVPEEARTARSFETIPLERNGKREIVRSIRPDGEAMVLLIRDHGYFVPGFEADCDSEGIPQIEAKYDAYIEVLDRKLYRSYFGADNFFVPLACTEDAQLARIVNMVRSKTEKKKAYRKNFWFKYHPTFDGIEKPRATGHIVEEPWLRIGENGQVEKFSLLQSS